MTPYYRDHGITLHRGDCRQVLPELPEKSVHCVITSPPYYGLRDYGTGSEQLGLEPTVDAYISNLVGIFKEVWRVLRDDGTAWIVIADSYAGSNASQGGSGATGGLRQDGRSETVRLDYHKRMQERLTAQSTQVKRGLGLKPKDLCLIPFRLALALQEAGWYVRNTATWVKPNPMPESVKDRMTCSTELILMLAKSARYFWDQEAVREPGQNRDYSVINRQRNVGGRNDGYTTTNGGYGLGQHPNGRNLRDAWIITPKPYPGAHFATFPPELVARCLKAGTSLAGACVECGKPWERVVERGELIGQMQNPGQPAHMTPQGYLRNGKSHAGVNAYVISLGFRPACTCGLSDTVPCTLLDPFSGSGTTGIVARRFDRQAILIEQSPDYCRLAVGRLTGAERPEDVIASQNGSRVVARQLSLL